MYDVIIIGNGPAGLSAALYIKRAGLSALIIGKDGGALSKAERIENYFGLEKPLSGSELLGIGKKQVTALGAELLVSEVIGISWNDNFTVETSSEVFEAKSVVFATGASRKTVKKEGLTEFEGKGVSYCAVCDAFFYRGKTVAVLGSGEYAVHELNELLPSAAKVYLLTDGQTLTAEPDKTVTVETSPVKRLYGGETLGGVEFADGRTLAVNGLFVALGTAGADALARKIGAEVSGNSIITDRKMKTNVPGLFAAGDCTGGVLQVSVAVGEGATAALSAIEFVRKAK